jgi:hypothetical protein
MVTGLLDTLNDHYNLEMSTLVKCDGHSIKQLFNTYDKIAINIPLVTMFKKFENNIFLARLALTVGAHSAAMKLYMLFGYMNFKISWHSETNYLFMVYFEMRLPYT